MIRWLKSLFRRRRLPDLDPETRVILLTLMYPHDWHE